MVKRIVRMVGHILVLSSMLTGGASAITPQTGSGPPSWAALDIPFAEDDGYALYTYVLFGRNPRLMGGAGQQTLERYENLLTAIGEPMADDKDRIKIAKNEAHIFMVPLEGQAEALLLKTYSDEVSRRVLSFTGGMLKASAPALSRRLSTGEGPFLITMPKPLKNASDQGAIMMFADLSAANPAVMNIIADVYRQMPDSGMLAIESIGLFREALEELIPVPERNLKIVAATRGDPVGVERHLWKSLTEMFSEEGGYGMYTYVLFNRRLNGTVGVRTDTLARYDSLLEAIHLSTLSVDEVEKHDMASTNILLIPVTLEVKVPNRNNYNTDVSMQYLTSFRSLVKATAPDISDRLAKRAGPFLISTLHPIKQLTSKRVDMLYADLSRTNPAAMEEIVSAYKQQVEKGLRHIERFRSLRLALLDLILDADDHIKIVQTAIAGE